MTLATLAEAAAIFAAASVVLTIAWALPHAIGAWRRDRRRRLPPLDPPPDEEVAA